MAGAVERIALIRIDDVISLPAVECFPVGSAAVLAVAQREKKDFGKPHPTTSTPILLCFPLFVCPCAFGDAICR